MNYRQRRNEVFHYLRTNGGVKVTAGDICRALDLDFAYPSVYADLKMFNKAGMVKTEGLSNGAAAINSRVWWIPFRPPPADREGVEEWLGGR